MLGGCEGGVEGGGVTQKIQGRRCTTPLIYHHIPLAIKQLQPPHIGPIVAHLVSLRHLVSPHTRTRPSFHLCNTTSHTHPRSMSWRRQEYISPNSNVKPS